jgi:hypothetical protein
MQDFIGEVLTTSYGDILLEKPGKLYVGGLFICETELKYGYNIHPQHIALERDRQTVSSFDLKLITKNMWIETGRYDAMACMIEEGIEDVDYVKYGTTELVKEACYRLFREKHPGAVVAENQKQLNELVERGMERVVVVGGTFYSQVSAHSQYASETKIIIETPTERLQRFFSKYRGNMRTEAIVAFKQLIQESGKWRSK